MARRPHQEALAWAGALATLVALIVALMLAGCSPLSNDATKQLFKTMEHKAGCGLIGGGAGSGAVIIPAPSVPLGGGYGYFWFAHADAHHSVEITKDGGCKITAKE